jgi:hypothetical protein
VSDDKSKQRPGELLTCELCGQKPESIAFDPEACLEECHFKRDPRPASPSRACRAGALPLHRQKG